jgi:creatinine amidohydrolase/Fe(II)-dependent formamide hydrolase-like protein
VHWVKPVAIAFTRAASMAGQPVTTDWGGEFEAAGLGGDHGGKWETSLMMALDPATVDLGELERRPEYVGVASGASAVESTIEQGRAWIDACAAALAREARWLVEHYPSLPPRHNHRR